jgi:hypothetical protein
MRTCYQYELINYTNPEVNWKTELRNSQAGILRDTNSSSERTLFSYRRQGEDGWCELEKWVFLEATARWVMRKIEKYLELMTEFNCSDSDSVEELNAFKTDTLSKLECMRDTAVCKYKVRQKFDQLTKAIEDLIDRDFSIPGLDFMTLEGTECDSFIID